MGLDMYLTGERNHLPDQSNPPMTGQRFRLGYWRKHPNLHGYIINHFAGGVDECQEIYLSKDNLRQILNAVLKRQLPHTDGFFFGKSDGSEMANDANIFRNAIKWLVKPDDVAWRSIVYQASW